MWDPDDDDRPSHTCDLNGSEFYGPITDCAACQYDAVEDYVDLHLDGRTLD